MALLKSRYFVLAALLCFALAMPGMVFSVSASVADIQAEFLARYPGWPKRVKEAVKNREVILYMTPEAVQAAWGLPESIQKMTIPGAEIETWYYSEDSIYKSPSGRVEMELGSVPKARFVQFQDGLVTSVIE